jgi:hypothetical protein
MNTTSLFVELIVIGIGACLWIMLIVCAIFGYTWIPTGNMFSFIAAIPFLAMIYVLGIVSDRLIDKLFDMIWGSELRTQYFKDSVEYFRCRRKVITSSERMANVIEYSRSRLRICRGWAVHSVLIALAIPIFAHFQLPEPLFLKVTITGFVVFGLLSAASYFAWKYLTKMQYLKIKEQAEYLFKNEGISND